MFSTSSSTITLTVKPENSVKFCYLIFLLEFLLQKITSAERKLEAEQNFWMDFFFFFLETLNDLKNLLNQKF